MDAPVPTGPTPFLFCAGGTLRQIAECLMEAPAGRDGGYPVMTSADASTREAVLAAVAIGGFGSTLSRLAD